MKDKEAKILDWQMECSKEPSDTSHVQQQGGYAFRVAAMPCGEDNILQIETYAGEDKICCGIVPTNFQILFLNSPIFSFVTN